MDLINGGYTCGLRIWIMDREGDRESMIGDLACVLRRDIGDESRRFGIKD